MNIVTDIQRDGKVFRNKCGNRHLSSRGTCVPGGRKTIPSPIVARPPSRVSAAVQPSEVNQRLIGRPLRQALAARIELQVGEGPGRCRALSPPPGGGRRLCSGFALPIRGSSPQCVTAGRCVQPAPGWLVASGGQPPIVLRHVLVYDSPSDGNNHQARVRTGSSVWPDGHRRTDHILRVRTGRQGHQPIGATAPLPVVRSPWSLDFVKDLMMCEVGSSVLSHRRCSQPPAPVVPENMSKEKA